jgi:hypothetical protein
MDVPVLHSLGDVAALVESCPPCFLRFSYGVIADLQAGRSRDYEADVELPGWSVIRIAPEPWWPREPEAWIARRIAQYAQLAVQGRCGWVVTGPVIAHGPDHEPLLGDLLALARLSDRVLADAVRCYHSAFRVGRDSVN